jgi:hypothetical protein
MSHDPIARRSLLKAALIGAVGASVSALSSKLGAAAAPALEPLSATDPQASALGYLEDASKATNPTHQAGQVCASCVQYQGKVGDARGACNIFPGKSVNAQGWCLVWATKPA